jgi:uroporphyrinogen-III synthase
MTMPVVVVRPQPGAEATAARLRALGVEPLVAPLFAVSPLPWTPPAPTDFDALLLTSANAVRHAGPALDRYRSLPVWCVGPTTTAAAVQAGFGVACTGSADAAQLLADPLTAGQRWLWLSGWAHQPLTAPPCGTLTIVSVYQSAPLPPSAPLDAALAGPAVILVHSAAAAARLVETGTSPALHHLVAISPAVAAAAGDGWRSVSVAPHPDDSEMVAIAAALCQTGHHE